MGRCKLGLAVGSRCRGCTDYEENAEENAEENVEEKPINKEVEDRKAGIFGKLLGRKLARILYGRNESNFKEYVRREKEIALRQQYKKRMQDLKFKQSEEFIDKLVVEYSKMLGVPPDLINPEKKAEHVDQVFTGKYMN